jgi:AraC family transcriptional regulator
VRGDGVSSRVGIQQSGGPVRYCPIEMEPTIIKAIQPDDQNDGNAEHQGGLLRIRGMVCARCIDVVQSELTQAGFDVLTVQLGKVTLRDALTSNDIERIQTVLSKQGFSLLEDQQKMTVHQRAKTFVDSYFAQATDLSESNIGSAPADRPNRRLSTQIQDALGLDYDTISGQFTKTEGITLERYIILRRIDKVKEWLVYSDETLTEIAHRTGYSSVQHLSNQFRQQTGLTPSYFRQVRQQKQALQQGTL